MAAERLWFPLKRPPWPSCGRGLSLLVRRPEAQGGPGVVDGYLPGWLHALIAHPQTVDAKFRKILRQPHFTWADHGEALLRRRKPWHYEHEHYQDVPVAGWLMSALHGKAHL